MTKPPIPTCLTTHGAHYVRADLVRAMMRDYIPSAGEPKRVYQAVSRALAETIEEPEPGYKVITADSPEQMNSELVQMALKGWRLMGPVQLNRSPALMEYVATMGRGLE